MRLLIFLVAATVAALAADIPRPLPGVTFRTPNGGLIDLAQYRGKVLAIEFLITTCPHCKRCSSLLQKMQNQYGPRGFQAVGIATNEMANMLVPDYVKELALSFPVGFAPRETAHEFLQHPLMLIMYMPQLVFADRKGDIRGQFPGESPFFKDEENNMRKQIESLLAEPAVTAKPAPARPGKE